MEWEFCDSRWQTDHDGKSKDQTKKIRLVGATINGYFKSFLEDLDNSVDQELYSSDCAVRDCSKVEKHTICRISKTPGSGSTGHHKIRVRSRVKYREENSKFTFK